PAQVVEFLVLDREFPRAVLYCVGKANQSLHAVSGSPIGTFVNRPEQLLGQLLSVLAYTRADEVVAGGLHEFVDDLQQRLNHVGTAICETFFATHPLETATAAAGV